MSTYWLIEWRQQPEPFTHLHPNAEWLSRRVSDWTVESVRVEKWTRDVQEAVRFPSKEDAEAVIGWLFGPDTSIYIATEHEDISSRSACEGGKQDDGKGQPVASSKCPICGVDAPHYHPPQVVSEYYQRVKSASMNQIPNLMEAAQEINRLPVDNEWPTPMVIADAIIKHIPLEYFIKAAAAPQGWQQGAAELARELADSIDFTGERWQAREAFESILRKHQEGNK